MAGQAVDRCLEKVASFGVDGVLFYQGEADAIDEEGAYRWPNRFSSLVGRFRGLAVFPWSMSGSAPTLHRRGIRIGIRCGNRRRAL